MTTRTDALNDAFDRLSGYAYLDGPGFACHGPMGAETLSTLGFDDQVADWVEAYKVAHPPIEAPPVKDAVDACDETSWRAALGDISRLSDWAVLFAHELSDEHWKDVVLRWTRRLLPGYAGALTHGLIRTAHAVRTIGREAEPSSLMIVELSRALALWAAAFTTLPGHPELRGTLAIDEALGRLPRPEEPWSPLEAGLFSRIHELRDFSGAVDAVGPPTTDDGALSEMSAAFCRILVANEEVFPVPLVHTVTPISGMRTLAPYATGLSMNALYAQLWHVGAAIVSGFTPPSNSAAHLLASENVPNAAMVIELAVEHGDPHVVKFAEACVSEHWLNPNPIYLLAAQSVRERTTPLGSLKPGG
jgi:hypothetical protein